MMPTMTEMLDTSYKTFRSARVTMLQARVPPFIVASTGLGQAARACNAICGREF